MRWDRAGGKAIEGGISDVRFLEMSVYEMSLFKQSIGSGRNEKGRPASL
jgi:hypothetical protein